MKRKVSFSSTGLVYGNLWGGGGGSYPARKLSADTKKGLIQQAEKGLNGTLDSGMGFESLVGALLHIIKTTYVVIDGEVFSNEKEDSIEFIGELTEEEKTILMHQYD